MDRIAGIQKSSNYQFSDFLLHLEISLIEEFDSIFKNDEEFLKLRSRNNWLTDGDVSTRFFQTSTLNRRRRNIILSLKDEDVN